MRLAGATDGSGDVRHRLAGQGGAPPLWQHGDRGFVVVGRVFGRALIERVALGVEQQQCCLCLSVVSVSTSR